MITDLLPSSLKEWQEVLPPKKYSLLFKHGAVPEDPTLTSEVLLIRPTS
jgi:hypothetical protein